MSTANGTDSSSERLCHIVKVDDFDGYGFNLHAEQGKPGQYIGKVDEGSPAEKAGLKEGDRILAVNGASIANDNHKQVVQKIKAIANETKLLVITPPPSEKVPGLNKTPPEITTTEIKTPELTKNGSSNKAVEKKEEKQQQQQQQQHIIENNGDVKKQESNNGVKSSPNKLNLTMTAAEMREKLAAKKRVDPKKIPMDLKDKFEIVKKL